MAPRTAAGRACHGAGVLLGRCLWCLLKPLSDGSHAGVLLLLHNNKRPAPPYHQTHTPTHAIRPSEKRAKQQRAADQAAALRALRPKAAQYAQQAAALGPLRSRIGELQQQLSTLDGEVRRTPRRPPGWG